MSKPIISIIIPVYNTEKYLERCINSLISQTLKNIEFIFVDDGSTDNSKNILNRYKNIDERIVVINQSNRGVSEARNNALNYCKGDYIGFVDSDDYVEKDMYEKMCEKAQISNSDIVICDYVKHIKTLKHEKIEYNKFVPVKKEELDINTFTREDFLINQKNGFLWNKVYKRKLIDENNIKFNSDISMCEDLLFNLYFLDSCKNIEYVNKYYYHYIVRENSAMHSIHINGFYGSIVIYKKTIESSILWGMDTEYIFNKIDEINSIYPFIYGKQELKIKNKSVSHRIERLKHIINSEYTQSILEKIKDNKIKISLKLRIFYSLYDKLKLLYIYLLLINSFNWIRKNLNNRI